jgi:hypothetical protein
MPLGHRQVFFFFVAFKGIQVITNIEWQMNLVKRPFDPSRPI